MKIKCLNFQDCGHVHQMSPQEIKELNVNQPFTKCRLCNYYALITAEPVKDQLDIKTYVKILNNFKEK